MGDSMEECNLWTLAQSGFVASGHPIQNVCLLCCFVSLLTFFVSSITFNYSQVDKIWSIVPFLYAWILITDSRTVLMAILTTIWGLRLTYNFARRGGYQWPPWCGDEDYRWAYIQRGEFIKPLANPIVYAIFNFTFISVYQNVLLLLIASPSIVAYTVARGCTNTAKTTGKLNILDYIATFLILSSITIETIADNQQYAFQTEKYRRREEKQRQEHTSSTNDEYSDGFCQSGLFSIVRKPNYAAEQFIWISYYLFSVAASGQWINWSIIGMILLVLLFQGSGAFTEQLTLPKYPKYSRYMQEVPLYVPNPLQLVRYFTITAKTTTKKND